MNEYELAKLQAAVDENGRKQDRVILLLEGDGTPENPGLKTRIDRLERIVAGGAWLVGLVGGPAIIAGFALFIHWIRTGGKIQ